MKIWRREKENILKLQIHHLDNEWGRSCLEFRKNEGRLHIEKKVENSAGQFFY